jgi:hypothetical protein
MAQEKEETASSASEKKEGSSPAAKTPREPMNLPSARQVAFGLFALLLALAAVFYVWWCWQFHVCVDNGVYAIVVTLAGFGLAGMWITLPPRHHPA